MTSVVSTGPDMRDDRPAREPVITHAVVGVTV